MVLIPPSEGPVQFALRLFHCVRLELLSSLGVCKGFHRSEPFKGVLAVENTRLVGRIVFCEQDAQAEAPVDGCAADQLKFTHYEGHLFACVDQQGAQADCVGVLLFSPGDDGLCRDLLA
jgi:hypothetical protein